MSGEFLKESLTMIIFLLPVLGLVWKGAKMAGRIDTLENENISIKKDLKDLEENFNKKHRLLEDRIEQERVATDSSIATIMSTLTEIQKSLVRVETKLDIEEKK